MTPKQSPEEPLRCKCGREPFTHDELPANFDVFCLMCGFGETRPTRTAAIKAWNALNSPQKD